MGNHTYSHLSLPDQTRAVVATEIQRCATVLRDVTGTAGRWFRPSGSNSTTTLINEEAGKAGYPIVLGFDTDPLDYQDPGATVVRSRVVADIQAGSLVSLHAQHQGTIDVFESLIGAIRDDSLARRETLDRTRVAPRHGLQKRSSRIVEDEEPPVGGHDGPWSGAVVDRAQRLTSSRLARAARRAVGTVRGGAGVQG